MFRIYIRLLIRTFKTGQFSCVYQKRIDIHRRKTLVYSSC